MRHREAGYRLLSGSGLEIGALNAAAALSKAVKVEYCDVLDRAEAIRRFPELDSAGLTDVDHILDMDNEALNSFDSASLDFIIANHVIAHVANPIRFLEEVFRVVKPGGHVVLSTGDKRYTFDCRREVTSFDTLLEYYRSDVNRVSDERYLDFLISVHPESVTGPEAIRTLLSEIRGRRESVNVWDSDAFVDFVERSIDLIGVAADRVYERSGQETRLEAFAVWRVRENGSPLGRGTPAPSLRNASLPQADNAAAVLLCGMHRSGTSILAATLKESGLWVGEEADLLPPHPVDNPDGYWERKDIHDAHVAYLSGRGFDWDRLSGFTRVDTTSPQSMLLKSMLSPAVEDLSRHGHFLLKDPRLCLLLPVWEELTPARVPIVAVRHPLEIASSLLRSPRGVYPAAMTLALWEKYLLRALKDMAGHGAIFVSYSQLIANPTREVDRVISLLRDAGVGGLRRPDSSLLRGMLKHNLRRHQASIDVDGVLDHHQRQLYELLASAANSPDIVRLDVENWPEPDHDLAQYEIAFDSRIEAARHDARSDQEGRLTELERLSATVLTRFQNQHLHLSRESARLAADLHACKQVLADSRLRLSEALERTDRDQVELARTRSELITMSRQVQATKQSVDAMKRSLSWRLTAPLRSIGALFSLRFPPGFEQTLYRAYYRMPGMSASRKHKLVTWMHEYLPWLTRSTVSYQLYRAGLNAPTPENSHWLQPRSEDDAAQVISLLDRKPLISILMPTYNTDTEMLQRAIKSVCQQRYDKWQLCIADDASSRKKTIDVLKALDDTRIKVVFAKTNGGIASASNAALELATGEYVALLDHDDELAPDALLEMVVRINEDNPDFIYSDEDKIRPDGQHIEPHFKSDYSPDLIFSYNYICHLSLMRTHLLRQIGGFRVGFDGSQDYDLFLRYAEVCQRIAHIPKVLYHWRMHEQSTSTGSLAKPKSWEAGRKAITDALERRHIDGRVDLGPYPNTYRVRRTIRERPLVSIVVPFRDKPELLSTCFESVLRKGGYENFEFLAVDNDSRLPATDELLQKMRQRDSRVRVLRFEQPFNYSQINNWAVAQSKGEVVLFLNNDIEAISADWITAMLEHAQRPEVGVVGVRLLYPDNTIQHGGVIVGLGGVAGHAHLMNQAAHPGYFSRAALIQNLSAVTFACAMVRRQVFDEVGGLNEIDLKIAFNDVDFCLRAREAGYLVVYTPHAELYHHESKSRGYEDTPEKQARFHREVAYMQRRHAGILRMGDPYYNPNLSLVDAFAFGY